MIGSLILWTWGFVWTHILANRLAWTLTGSYLAFKVVWTIIRVFMLKSEYARLIAKRRKTCDDSFRVADNLDHGIPSELVEKILQVDATELRELMWSKKVTSEQVLKLYFSRAATVGRAIGAAIEGNWAKSLELAKKADLLIRTTPREKLPPLCGLPFSVKENFLMEGFEITHGLPSRIGKKSERTSSIVEELVKRGAIPFVRTNVPQLLMAYETDNPVYGICVNPHNPTRSPGGSSGGEGAILGAACSPLGIGNDIGGSVRIPALFSGVFGLKPTTSRFNISTNTAGIHVDFNDYQHQDYIRVTNGPLGRSTEDLRLMMAGMAALEANNHVMRSIAPVPWREQDCYFPKGQKLTIGYIESLDEVFEVSPPNKRAAELVVNALKKEGHKVIKFIPPNVREMQGLITRFFISDGPNEANMSYTNGVKIFAAYKPVQLSLYMPDWLKKIAAKLLSKDQRLADDLLNSVPIPAKEMFIYANKHTELTMIFLATLQEQGITHLIAPGMGLPPVLNGTTQHLLINLSYTCLFNFLGFPAGALPVTEVKPEEEHYESRFDDKTTKAAKECMKGSAGLPIGVQVATLPYKDEECLAFMGYIEGIMKLKPKMNPNPAPKTKSYF